MIAAYYVFATTIGVFPILVALALVSDACRGKYPGVAGMVAACAFALGGTGLSVLLAVYT